MISGRSHAAVSLIALVCCVNVATARSQGHRPLQVSFTPSILRPGDVARIDIGGLSPEEQITATMLEQDLVFHFDEPQQIWRALVGVDLDTKPGAYRLRINRMGSDIQTTRAVRIVPKTFPVRRLRVPGRFVDPSPEALEQIARDGAVLSAAYARISPKKWNGAFVLPVDGKPTSNFGTRSIYNGQARAPHAGIDFAGGVGTPIRAANYGEVVVAAPMYFTGNTIVIDYGDRLFSIFAHLSEMHVQAGETVEPTTIVGRIGSTGRVTGPHLHWSVRLNGARVDPLSLILASSW